MKKSIPSATRLSVIFVFLICALLPSRVNASSDVPPLADVAQRPLAAPCGTVTIQDNIVASSAAAPFTFYYDIGPQDNVAGMYIGYSITNTAATTSPDIWIKLDTFSATTVRLGAGEDGVYHLGPLGAGETKPVYFYLTINGDPGDIPALNETFQVNIYNNDPTLGGEVCDYTDTINSVDETIDANSNKVVTSVATANPPTIGSLMTITVIGETGTIGAGRVFKLSPASLSTWPADTFKMVGVHIDYWNNSTCPAAGGVPAGAPTNQYDRVLVFQTPSVRNSCYRIVYSFTINGTTTTPTDVMPVNEISSGQEIKHTGAYANPILPIQNPLNSTLLDKTVTPSAFPPATGNTVTYTVTVSNSSGYEVVLDGFTDTLPAGTTYVANSTLYNSVAKSDPNISGNTLKWSGMFSVGPNGTSTLVYQAQRNQAIGSFTNSVIANIGSVQIDKSLDTSNNSPAQATYTVATPNPALTIDKTSPTGTYDSVGDVLTYSYLITNSGNVTLTGPFTVVDDKSANESCPAMATLAPGATLTCSASYTVTQADIDSGSVTNHAYAQGNFGASVISSAQDSVTINATQTPALTLKKSVLETSYDAVGDTLTYSYEVTNTGNTTLYNISVSDDKTTVTCPDTSGGLPPTGEITCNATYSVIASDLTNGNVTNQATASSGSTTSNKSSATVNLAQGTLTVVKVVVNDNGGTLSAADFSFSVNSGAPVAFEADGQNDLTVIPGTFTVTETAPAGYAVSYDNCTSVTVPEDGTATCTITNDDIAPSLTLVKTVTNDNGGSAIPGDWTLTASGPTTLTGNMSGTGYTTPVTSGADFEAGTYTLSESGGPTGYSAGDWSCEDAAGSPVDVVNDQVVIGLDEDVTCTINNDDLAARLTVRKVVINDNGGTLTAGDFSFSVNSGTAIDFEVDGENLLTVDAGTYSITESAPAGYAVSYDNCSDITLTSGGSAICTVTNDDIAPTLTLVKAVINDNGGTAQPDDFNLTVGGSAVLSGVKSTVDANTAYAIDESAVTGYSFVSISGDAKCPAALGGTVTLEPGDDVTCTITNDDIAPTLTLVKAVINDNGGTAQPDDFNLTVGGNAVLSGIGTTVDANTAYAIDESVVTGYSFVSISGDTQCPAVLGGTVTLEPGDDVTCTITNDDIAPSLTLVKTVTNDDLGSANAGAWTLTATGPTTLTGSMSGAEYTTPVTSGTDFAAGTYTLSESGGPADYTAGLWSCVDGAGAPVSVVNDQVAIGLTDDITCTINNNDNSVGSISVEKTSSTTSVSAVNQVVPYTFTVTNSGSLPLTNVTVSDPMCDDAPEYDSGDANTDLILQVSETWVYTCSHTVTQSELDKGGYLTNTVTADAGEADPAQDVLNIPITQGPAITLTKNGALDMTVVDPDDETNAGDTITYTFVVENTGNVSLVEDIVITDAKLNSTAPNVVCTITLADPLEVGETASCTATLYPYVLTLSDISAGAVENTAGAATTFDDDGDPATDPVDVTDSDDAVVETNPNPALTLEKAADPTSFSSAGDVITYTYTLTNTGNITLYEPYYVTDDHISTVSCPSTPVSLAPGESVTCSAAYSITTEDVSRGSVTNLATAFAPWIAGCTLNSCVEIANSGEATARITQSGANGGGDDEKVVAAAALQLPATGFAPGKVTLLDINEKVDYAATEMRLEIPDLGVNIPVSGVPFKNGGWNVNWLWNQAGWLEGTAFPTSSGNSVITSHVYLPTGAPGPFVGITNLRWGDQIMIKNGGITYTYEVRSVKRVKPESVALVMKHEKLAWLTLLTCQGFNADENTYDYRVAVRAVLVSVK